MGNLLLLLILKAEVKGSKEAWEIQKGAPL